MLGTFARLYKVHTCRRFCNVSSATFSLMHIVCLKPRTLTLYWRWKGKTVRDNSQTNSLICSGQELSLPCMGFLCLFTSCKNTPFEEAYGQSTYYYTKWPKGKMYTQNFIFFPFVSSLIFSPLCKCVEDKCLKVIINWNWEKRPENILGKYRNLKW